MVKNLKPVVVVVVALLVVGAAGALGYAGLQTYRSLRTALGCDVTTKEKVVSPNRDLIAVVFEKNCGATTPENTQIGIQRSSSRSPENDLTPFVVVHGHHRLAIKWLDNDHIEITLPKNDKVYRQNSHAEGVSVTYR